jgi:hypothetical protein
VESLDSFEFFKKKQREASSKMEAFDESHLPIRGTTVGEVLDANNEDLKVFVEKFKKEYRKQWQVRSTCRSYGSWSYV